MAVRILFILLIALVLAGCRPAAPGGGGAPAAAPRAEEPDAPKGEAIADPVLREARGQADVILAGLLAGQYDDDWASGLAAVARKLKGYRTYAVKSQKMDSETDSETHAAFGGVLTGPAGSARFDMLLVKQQGGQWAVGTFGGPDPR
jgi:hypothetical protein